MNEMGGRPWYMIVASERRRSNREINSRFMRRLSRESIVTLLAKCIGGGLQLIAAVFGDMLYGGH